MKLFALTLILLISLTSVGQNLDQCGLDDNPYLNATELEFLNAYLTEKSGEKVDLTGKKIIFAT